MKSWGKDANFGQLIVGLFYCFIVKLLDCFIVDCFIVGLLDC